MSCEANLRGTAEELRREYAHLLCAVRPAESPFAARSACEALEEARRRLTGQVPPVQLTLDVRQR